MVDTGDAVYVVTAPAGAEAALAAPPPRPQGDYGWTESPAVEGLFVVLTAVAVPVAIVRWARRLRPLIRAVRPSRAES